MSRVTFSAVSVLLALGVTVTPALAQTPAACKPVSAAMTKLLTTDHANVSTSRGITSQGITAGGVNYIQVRGVWRKSPMSPQDMLKQEEENIRNAKNYTCKALADEVVDGAPASVYTTHSESDAGVADAKVWISKSSGLPLKTEEDLETLGHVSIVYSYTNIHAPVVK